MNLCTLSCSMPCSVQAVSLLGWRTLCRHAMPAITADHPVMSSSRSGLTPCLARRRLCLTRHCCCGAAQYRYFVFLFLITAQAVITCQYDPFAPPGYHGEVNLVTALPLTLKS